MYKGIEKINHQLICIKENIHNKIGDIVNGFDYVNTDDTEGEIRRIVSIETEPKYTYRTTFENFMTLAEFREQRINSILN
jgi:hypothetical protein